MFSFQWIQNQNQRISFRRYHVRSPLEDVFTVGYESEAIVVRERLNARKLWDAVERNAARTANAELLLHFFSLTCYPG